MYSIKIKGVQNITHMSIAYYFIFNNNIKQSVLLLYRYKYTLILRTNILL